jgi:hypothetical protein
MRTAHCLYVHFFHLTVICQKTVDFDLYIGRLRVDGGSQAA